MVCPNCGYNDNDYDHKDYAGGFFELRESLKRKDEDMEQEQYLYGCPSCKYVWMDY